MGMFRYYIVVSAIVVALIGVAAPAEATISLPDSGNCNLSACWTVQNTAAGNALVGITANGIGVSAGATGSGTAVRGQIPSVGSGNAVVGETFAATTAVYGNNLNGNGYAVLGQINGNGTAVRGDNPGSGLAGYFNGNVTVTGTFNNPSDLRLKNNVQPMKGALDQLTKLRGVTYEWKEPGNHGNRTGLQRGFIAQDVQKVMPEWVRVDPQGWNNISIPGLALEAMLVESVRTLKAENDELRERVNRLERGGRPTTSTLVGGGAGLALAIGLLPVGFVALRRRRRVDAN